ncbi:hypothetical protein BJV77DRAFT_964312 [Russula vinacea]|nr:hypothetical protein BJV77DRAFT_964312 [Russula vinacea]
MGNRPTRGADDPDAPRSEHDAVRGEVETQRSNVGAEEVLETRAGPHEVKQVTERKASGWTRWSSSAQTSSCTLNAMNRFSTIVSLLRLRMGSDFCRGRKGTKAELRAHLNALSESGVCENIRCTARKGQSAKGSGKWWRMEFSKKGNVDEMKRVRRGGGSIVLSSTTTMADPRESIYGALKGAVGNAGEEFQRVEMMVLAAGLFT